MTEENTIKENDSVSKSELSDLLACYCGCTDIIQAQSFSGACYYECKYCGKMSILFGNKTYEEAKNTWNNSLTS